METFAALADPTRRQIVDMLASGELAAGDIARRFEMSAPAISQHLKALKAARLVRVRIDAQRRIYSLDPEGIEAVEKWLANIRRFWGPKLDALESALNAAAERDSENDRN
ncbi:MAG: metalloregulator ArsR/SmtB family transcription factor [Alphaproteobacteria bacterium]|nr:metalloregulator ArsR/SmtB family transcription factor [Alphaproteobacteria bacterium]MDX5415929.1 metalloregulator ArsR/SmtB family transcription factor [Alphaproteobacteria bacterium]MDX5493222.1 metalloregulator ArsR/SmtB family transcription factor [Alphaproteobacteria bacterium]